MSKIRETIDHGNYHNEREIEYPDGVGTFADDAVAALKLLGHTSPYPFTFSPANPNHAQAAYDLEHKGSCDIGWATYEIVDDETENDETESVSVSEMDNLVARASAWDAVSNALDDNAVDLCSAADVCQVGFDQQEELRKAAENA